MKRFILTVKKDEQSDPELLEVPGEQPAVRLVGNLVKALSLPEKNDNNIQWEYWLETSAGKLIPDDTTLTEAGITDGSVLTIRRAAYRPAGLSGKQDKT